MINVKPSVSKERHFQNVFRPHENEKSAFSTPPVERAFLKSSVSGRRSMDGGPTSKRKIASLNLSAEMWKQRHALV